MIHPSRELTARAHSCYADAVTVAGEKALRRAASRVSGCICPTPGLAAAAQSAVLARLQRDGFASVEMAPRITAAGRAALRALDVLDATADASSAAWSGALQTAGAVL